MEMRTTPQYPQLYNGYLSGKWRSNGYKNLKTGDLFDYYLEYPEEMSGEFQALLDDGDPVRQVVCDYIACMTDRFAVAKYKTLFIPQEWTIL